MATVDAAPDAADAATVGTPTDAQSWPSRQSAYYSLFVMTVVVMFTVIDRQVLALMLEPIKTDFHVTDVEAAFLVGAAFSITYGVAGIPIARIADRSNRRNLVAASLAFWSLCTMACGIAQSYFGLVLARLGIGIGESGYGPASWSIATDNFPREKVAFATGTYGIGAMAGIGLASFMGGAVLAFAGDMPPVALPFGGVIRPWQWAFIVVGLPGLLWTVLVMTTKEPPRRGLATGQKARAAPVAELVRWLRDNPRAYVAVLGGICVKQLVMAGPTIWGATFYYREFGWTLAKAGIVNGIITLVASPPAMIIGGKLSERWLRRGRRDANLRINIIAIALAVPLLVIYPLLHKPEFAIAGQLLAVFCGTLGFGPGIAAFQVITPNRMRAQVSSLAQFSTNVIAFALSPLIVAVFTEYLFRDPHALKYSMALSALTTGALALLITIQGLGPYGRAYEHAERENF